MRRPLVSLVPLLLGTVTACGPSQPPGPPPGAGVVAIVGAQLIDGTGSDPIAESVVLVRDGRIETVGPQSSTPVPDGAEVIDATSQTIMPGLVDTQLVTGKDVVVACADCGARHHKDCHQGHGRCATCNSTSALYSRTMISTGRNLRRLHGSCIQVDVDEGGTTFSWPFWSWAQSLFLIPLLFLILFPPLLILFFITLWHTFRIRISKAFRIGPDSVDPWCEALRITPDSIEFGANAWLGICRARMLVPREDLGEIKVDNCFGMKTLSLDVGVRRYHLWMNPILPVMTAPEQEWLAKILSDWKQGKIEVQTKSSSEG